jgi:predicted nuclease with TOPRIM domain
MSYDILLWIAFLAELLIGIAVGWFFASFFGRRYDSFEDILVGANIKELSGTKSTGSALSGKVGVMQAIAQDRTTLQKESARLEHALTQTETKLHKANTDLGTVREALTWSEAETMNLKTEIAEIKDKLVREQTLRLSVETQAAQYQKQSTEAQALTKAFEATKADLNKTILRLQKDLDAAVESREQLVSQLAVYREKMRFVSAQIDRTKSA